MALSDSSRPCTSVQCIKHCVSAEGILLCDTTKSVVVAPKMTSVPLPRGAQPPAESCFAKVRHGQDLLYASVRFKPCCTSGGAQPR